ncbi:MAG TPA: ABC transporter ATP-binding protein, partial [Clostridiales bacterium]|nr:ABC transporter ATP-binding protein [Clostridiales bacterium]
MKLVVKNLNRIYEKDGYKTHALTNVSINIQDGDQVMIT